MTGAPANSLPQFVEQLDDAQTLQRMEAVMAEAFERLGVKYYTYHIIRTTTAAGRLPYFITNYPEQWIRRYIAESYVDDDPIVGELLRRKLPFPWSAVVGIDDTSRRQRLLMDEARGLGIFNGLSFPLIGRDGEVASM